MSPMGGNLHNLHGSLSDNLQHLFPATPSNSLSTLPTTSEEGGQSQPQQQQPQSQEVTVSNLQNLNSQPAPELPLVSSSSDKAAGTGLAMGLSVSTELPHMNVTILSTPPAAVERAAAAKKEAEALAAQQHMLAQGMTPTGLFLPAPSPSSFFN